MLLHGTVRRMPTTRIPVIVEVRGQRVRLELTYAERRDVFRALEGQPVARPTTDASSFVMRLEAVPALARSA